MTEPLRDMELIFNELQTGKTMGYDTQQHETQVGEVLNLLSQQWQSTEDWPNNVYCLIHQTWIPTMITDKEYSAYSKPSSDKSSPVMHSLWPNPTSTLQYSSTSLQKKVKPRTTWNLIWPKSEKWKPNSENWKKSSSCSKRLLEPIVSNDDSDQSREANGGPSTHNPRVSV